MKIYSEKFTYDVAMERIAYIFENFDNVILAFSGGKDSGLMLNLCVKYLKDNNSDRKIHLFHTDVEAQYTATTEYVEKVYDEFKDYIIPWWCCLPLNTQCSTSMFQSTWKPWDVGKKDIWVRELPKKCYNIDNHPFTFYKVDMSHEDFNKGFSVWHHKHHNAKNSIVLVGIRADESLNRWRAVTQEKSTFNDNMWTTKLEDDCYAGYPIYDWSTEDIWIANGKFGFNYNRIYDLYHYAGLSIHQMRVASPFNDCASDSLKLYRVIEPDIWAKMLGRVEGANFTAIYGGTLAMAWKGIKLPKNHTWKSYLDFLLNTLPEDTRNNYLKKFNTSIEFWKTKGGVLNSDTLNELDSLGIKYSIKGKTNYKTDKNAVIFEDYPDDADVKDFSSVPSYKRMVICILKNDHHCKYMGFSASKKEIQIRDEAVKKYKVYE